MKLPKISDFTWVVIITLPLFTYIHLRGSLLALTYDECWTFLGYAQGNILDVMLNTNPAANNHILHSLLVTISVWMFGNSEYAIRLPSMISFVVFAFFMIQLLRAFSPKYWLLGLTFILYQPYLLDYFVAARGYGWALASMSGGIWHLVQLNESRHAKHAFNALLYAFLSAYFNFTFLLFFLAAGAVIVALALTKRVVMQRSIFIRSILIVVAAGVLFIPPLSSLIHAEELYYGGSENFFDDTLVSLAFSLLYHGVGSLLLAVVISISYLAFGFVLLLQKRFESEMIFWIIGVLIAVATIGQHILLGTPYLIDRTALILAPFLLLTLFLISSVLDGSLIRVYTMTLVLLAIGNTLWNVNFTHLIDFKEYADVDGAMQLIDQEFEGELAIGKSTYLNAPINYYAATMQNVQVQPSGLEYCAEAPVFILFDKDSSCAIENNLELIEQFEVSGLRVYKKRKPSSGEEGFRQPN